MYVGAGPEQALSGLPPASRRPLMPMQRADVVAGIAEAEAMAPQNVGDAVVAAQQAQGHGTGMEQAGFNRCIAADRPGVLAPLGIGVQGCGVVLLRLMAGQSETVAWCRQTGRQVCKALPEGDVRIGQQDDRIALLATQFQPVGEGGAAIQGDDFAGSGAGGQRRC